MNDLVDFHIHSNRSCDGDFSPAELVRFATDKGFRAISIADHDTVAAYPEAIEDGKQAGVEVIPSIEVTTLYDDREFHLLLPFVDWGSEAVGRDHRAHDRIADGRGPGAGRASSGTAASSSPGTRSGRSRRSCPPLGVKIAQILLDKPESEKMPGAGEVLRRGKQAFGPYMFYRDYFMEGKPAFVPKRHIPLEEVLAAAPRDGRRSRPFPSRRLFPEDDAARTSRTSRSAGSPASRSIRSTTRPSRPRSTGRWPTSSTSFRRPARISTARSSPTSRFGALTDGRYWMVEELRRRRPQ